MTNLPKFSTTLLHPRYWLTWLGIGILWLVMQLPYPVIYHLSCGLGKLALHFMKQHAKIVHHNLELCFPEMSKQEHHKMVVKNFKSIGMGLMETSMAWFWPDHQITHWTEVISMEHIHDMQAQKHSILLVGIHFLTLELGAQQFGMQEPGIGVYHPNNNPLIDWLQTWGHLRSNKSMLNHKDLKGMIKALKKGKVVWYTPDHDYSPRSSIFIPLFAIEQAATTTRTWMLAQMSSTCLVPFIPHHKPDGKGYQLIMLPPECSPPLDDAKTTTTWMNKVVKKCIMMAPEQYMWLHHRFKTHPEGIPSHY